MSGKSGAATATFWPPRLTSASSDVAHNLRTPPGASATFPRQILIVLFVAKHIPGSFEKLEENIGAGTLPVGDTIGHNWSGSVSY